MLTRYTHVEWMRGWVVGTRLLSRMQFSETVHAHLRNCRPGDAFSSGYVAALSVAVGF